MSVWKGGFNLLVEKVINNNLVRSRNEKNQEVLVMGCGLGFKKQEGDCIDDTKIEKIYTMVDVHHHHQLEEILSRVTFECIQVTNETVDYARISLGKQISDNIYLPLCDHISFALERFEKGIRIQNALLSEIKRFYNHEYQIGIEALEMIAQKMKVRLPDDEAGFIALHIVNASFDSIGLDQTKEMMKVIQKTLQIVKYHFQIELDETSIHYDRFLTHLKFFVKRVFSNVVLEEKDDTFFLMIKQQYQEEYTCVLKVYEFLRKEYNLQMTNDEIMYLMIHIHRITTM